MNSHLNDEQLINFAYRALTDTQRETMELHLTTCRDCRARLSEHEALQRRIHYNVTNRRRGATPSARMRFAAIAPKLKRSRRIAMFFTGSKQFLYGVATLAILVLLGVGLYVLVSNVGQPTPAPQEAISRPTSTPIPSTATPTPAAARSQTSEWLVYNTENSGLPQSPVIALAFDTQENLWIGTLWGGLAKFDGETWTVYNTDNSGLPSDQVSALAFDAQGTLWVGTSEGLAKFDRETWTVYTTDNSDLPYDSIHELLFDPQGSLWIGTGKFHEAGGGGLAKFDGETWTIHTKEHSGLPGNQILALAVDPQGNLWAGTEGDKGIARFDGETWIAYTADNTGLRWGTITALAFDAQGTLWVANGGYGVAKFDGANWTEYNPRNSELPAVAVSFHSGHVFDGQGNLWIATDHRGMMKFDGQSWLVYNEDNSGLPENNVWIITIDAHGNKWIGTDRGLAVYREGGVILTQTPTPAATIAETPTSVPAEAQLELTSGYVEVDGVNLYYEIMGSGPPLVLLHDLLLHREVWDGQFEVLAKEYTVIRYDQRNYGLSESSDTSYVDVEDLYVLLQSLEIGRATLIGSSYGGQVALDFALAYPDMVATLVLVGAPINGVSFPDNDALSVQWRGVVLHRTFDVSQPGGRLHNADEAKEAIDLWFDFPNSKYWIMPEHDEVQEQARQLLLANLQNLIRPRYIRNPDQLATGRLSEIQVPTLVIVGEADTPGLLDHANKLAVGIAGAEKVVIPDAAHMVHLEQPEAFNQAVLDFLRRQ